MSENPHLLSNEIHGTFGATLTGTGFSTRITGLANIFPTGDPRNDYLYKRVLREYYRNLDNHGFTGFQTDAVDAGFTPSTITGFFDPTINSLLGVTPATLLLDIFSGSLFAFSLQKINSNYSGPALKIRRTEDNVEANIAFNSSNQVDTDSSITITNGSSAATTLGGLLTEGGNNNARVVTWYDQEGSNNATQPTLPNQPKFATNGALITVDGKPEIQFNSSDQTSLILPENCMSGLSALSFFNVHTPSSNADTIFSARLGSDTTIIFENYYFNGYTWRNLKPTITISSSLPPFDQRTLHSYTTSEADDLSTIFIDGQQRFSGSVFRDAVDLNSLQVGVSPTIGGSDGDFFHNGSIAELVAYNVEQTQDLSGINDNINSRYSIYS